MAWSLSWSVACADGDCAGGTSVEALQIAAYDGATAGGGSLALSGSLAWNSSPSTSLPGFETDCSVGPLLAYTHEPEDPCQYDQ